MRFGKLIGAGQAGYVFQNMDNPEHYLKLVQLPKPDEPLSANDALLAVNQQQSELIQVLFRGNAPQVFPVIYNYSEGKVTPMLRRQLIESADDFGWNELRDEVLRDFRTGRQYAVWEMEAIPCTDANDFCDRYSQLPTPMDNRDYQELLNYLLSIGFVVRDIRNPDNYGFRTDGTQVFYDPVVAPWPVSESDRTENPNRYAAFVASFGRDGLETVARAIESGDYFNWYHGQAVMQSETDESDSRIPVEDSTNQQWRALFDEWVFQEDFNEDGDTWLFEENDGDIEYLLNLWHRYVPSLVRHPAFTRSINWWSPLTDAQIKATKTFLNNIWRNFVNFWEEIDYFSEWYYPSAFKYGDPESVIWEYLENWKLRPSEIVMPMKTFVWNLQYAPEQIEELKDGANEGLFNALVVEQNLIENWIMETFNGNLYQASEALQKVLPNYLIEKKNGSFEFHPNPSLATWPWFYEEYSNQDSLEYARDAGIDPEPLSFTLVSE